MILSQKVSSGDDERLFRTRVVTGRGFFSNMIIDTHCHLDFPDFEKDRGKVLERAKAAGVGFIINIGISSESSKKSLELSKKYPSIYASVGIHPHYAKDVDGKIPDELISLASSEKVVAIGEIGLDYYRNLSPKNMQRGLFTSFIKLAGKVGLPVVVHSREAEEDTVAILKDNLNKGFGGVMHCFSGSRKALAEYLKLGFFISFTCNITYKKATELRAVVKEVPLERLLLETDAPYLSPQKLRGKRNEPSNLKYLVEELSALYGLSEADIARITTHNAKTLFGLPVEEKAMITYPIRDSLYINITNECTNDCDFCVRNSRDFVKGHNLRLDKEPSAGEIIDAIGDPARYKEIVFCGYGEPTMRLDIVKEVAGHLKKNGKRVRMVTNGEGDLVNDRPIAKELAGLVDKVSISLNVDTKENYDRICRSRFGAGTFDKIKEFAKECKSAGIEVELTFLNLPGVDRKRCKIIATDELNVGYRMRNINIVG